MKKILLLCVLITLTLSGCTVISSQNKNQQTSDLKETEQNEFTADTENVKFKESESENTEVPMSIQSEYADALSQKDMTGDYVGTIPSQNQPADSTYTVYNENDYTDCLVLAIENIDNSNIRFHLSKAIQDADMNGYVENLLFNEHVAHYTESGLYEYIGDEYHLYFKYNPGSGNSASENTVEAYGFGDVFDIERYGNAIQYNGMQGIEFIMNVPFAG